MKRMTLKSKLNDSITWNIEVKSEITEEDRNFIENLNIDIYHNDLTSQHWCFDTKLPSGKWLENITFNNELTKADALIL